jgi:hypothetical protein
MSLVTRYNGVLARLEFIRAAMSVSTVSMCGLTGGNSFPASIL